MTPKTAQERERELMEERARLIREHVQSTPDVLRDVQESIEAEERGEGIPMREYLKQRGRQAL